MTAKETYDPIDDLPESEAISKQHYIDLADKIDDSIKENKREHKVLTDNDEHVKRKQDEQAKRLDELNKLLLALAARIEPILKNREDMDAATRFAGRIIRPLYIFVLALGATAASIKSIQWILDAVRHWK